MSASIEKLASIASEALEAGRPHLRGVELSAWQLGELEALAASMSGWAEAMLSDYRVRTGYPLAHEWQEEHGALPIGERLVPIIPFVCGGEFEIANLHALDAAKGMRFRADLHRQIKDLPPGTEIELKFE